MKERRIVQIAFDPAADEGSCVGVMFALCDDQTIWIMDHQRNKWRQYEYPSIPQPEEENDED